MPIYEFTCSACGERFDALVPGGTQSVECRACGKPGSERVLSRPAEPMRLVKTGAEKRRLEDARGTSREGAKQRFKESRARARQARGGRAGGGSR